MHRKEYSICSEAEYRNDLTLLSIEIEDAVTIYQILEAMNQLALDDLAIFRALNNEARFWQGYRSTGQTALFMNIGRIFDKSADAHSIHKLVDATITHWEFFSRSSLRARRLGGRAVGDVPEWLDNFVARAWEPTFPTDLEFLRMELTPRAQRFQKIYKPIRDSVYGHRLMADDHAAATLFLHTNRQEIGDMLDFLHGLIDILMQMYDNGHQPLFTYDFKDYNVDIREQVRRVLTKLAA